MASRTEVPLVREEGWGYQHEARHVQQCLQEGRTESRVWNLDKTLELMQTLDRVRVAMGLIYAVD